jgi:DNA-binding NtrC family response regulator
MAHERKGVSDKTTLGDRGSLPAASDAAPSLALTILGHPSVERIGDRALGIRLAAGKPALISRNEPVFVPPGQAEGEPIGDESLSRKPLRLKLAGDGGVALEIGESSTVVVIGGQRVKKSAHCTAAQVRRGVVLELGRRVVLLLHAVGSAQGVFDPTTPLEAERELVGESDGLCRVLWEIRSVADIDVPILLRGETGCGKELVARAVHRASPRRDRPFVAVNLGAISPSLAVAELFGAERGAYTGAVKRQPGYFEQARGGTLLLDEVGEAPAELQVALLRVLETGEMQPVGAQEIRKADVRVIAATDANLEANVAAGTFRAPLLNRLSAYEIRIPPLRERRDDIGRLCVRFLREELERIGESRRLLPPAPGEEPWLASSVVVRLAEFDWPGNIRQLRNVVRQLVIGNRGRDRLEMTATVERLFAAPASASAEAASEPEQEDAVSVEPGPRIEAAPPPSAAPTQPSPRLPRRRPAGVTDAELADALRASRWDLAAAAVRLNISRASLYLLIERDPRFRKAGDVAAEEIIRCYEECGGDLSRMVERLEVSERALQRRVRELGLGSGKVPGV